MKFTFIRAHRACFDVDVMCSVFAVTRAGFYAWLDRPESARAARARELTEQIRTVHHDSNRIYGALKITHELHHRRCRVNRKTVARLMRTLGIRSKVVRKFRVRTTDSRHANPVAPNTLARDFARATAPDQVWGADITYIHTDEGFLYLAGVMDFCSRKIVGWSMSDTMTTDLVENAFTAAVSSRKDALGLLHHSDRGVQYTSARVRRSLIGQRCRPPHCAPIRYPPVMRNLMGLLFSRKSASIKDLRALLCKIAGSGSSPSPASFRTLALRCRPSGGQSKNFTYMQ